MGVTGGLVMELAGLWRHSRPVLTSPFWRKIQTTQQQRGHQQQSQCRQQQRATATVRQLTTAMEGQHQTTATTMGTSVGPLEPGQVKLLLTRGVLTTAWPPRPTLTAPVTCASAGRGRGDSWAGRGAGPSVSAVWLPGPGPGTRGWQPGATTTVCMTRPTVQRRCATAARHQHQQHNNNLFVFLTTLYIIALLSPCTFQPFTW